MKYVPCAQCCYCHLKSKLASQCLLVWVTRAFTFGAIINKSLLIPVILLVVEVIEIFYINILLS